MTTTKNHFLRPILASAVAVLLSVSLHAETKVDGKIVLANLDRYPAHIRVGTKRREIKPKKASVLTPRRYPATVEYWSGNTKTAWQKQKLTKAGIYAFNFKRGHWMLTEVKKGKTRRPAPRPSPRVVRQQIVRQPVRRAPINADRVRWSPLARGVYAAAKIYQFVRDEKDRELLRELLIRAREDEDWDRLERWIREEPIPELYKRDLREAFEELARLSDSDWKDIDTSDEKDWEIARKDLGDLLSKSEWDNIENDFADVDTKEFWVDDVDIDLGDLQLADNYGLDGQLDLGDFGLAEGLDLGDLGVDVGSFDLSDFDDFGGYDGAFDVDVGDFGGGYFGDDDFGDFGGFDDFDF